MTQSTRSTSPEATGPRLEADLADGVLRVRLAGRWRIGTPSPPVAPVIQRIREAGVRRVALEAADLGGWDSTLLVVVARVGGECRGRGIELDSSALPDGIRKLLGLATAVAERKDAAKVKEHQRFLERLGGTGLGFWQGSLQLLSFIGEAGIAVSRLAIGRARFRGSDLLLFVQQCGAEAVPIVSLISFLVGLILAFVGAVQLSMFGAQVYVADLVGVAMTRVLAAVMTGIIMTGRTGASFAAQLGTMQVNEEIDALETLGVSPMEFLVLPRMLALVLMMPLLCLYADLLGMAGGLTVGIVMLDLNAAEYMSHSQASVTLTQIGIGLFHSLIFGIIVALTGCLRGMQCGRSSAAVGSATTSAVVSGIVGIVVATAIITVLCNILGI